MLVKAVGTNDAAQQILKSDNAQMPSSFSPDGKLLAYMEIDKRTGQDVWVVSLEGDRVPRPFARTEFNEARPVFSPNGAWIAYESNESGRTEVYIARYPGGGEKKQVSIEGGAQPTWGGSPPRAAGRAELYYRVGDQLMVADVTTRPSLLIDKPRRLFNGSFTNVGISGWSFAPLPGGQRFVLGRAPDEPVREVRLLLNWFDELKRRVPVK
jgi:hypothetical protein